MGVLSIRKAGEVHVPVSLAKRSGFLQAHRDSLPPLLHTCNRVFHATALIFVVAGCFMLPGAASAQTRIGFHVGGGGVVPVGPAHRLVASIEEGDDSQQISLRNWRPSPGFSLDAALLLNDLTVGYTLRRSGWRSDRTRCRSTEDSPPASQPGDGSVDDIGVNYQCGATSDGFAPADGDRRGWMTHSIYGAYRIYLTRLARPRLYALVGAGLSLNTLHATDTTRRLRVGGSARTGGGLDLYLSERVALNLEIVWETSLYRKSGSWARNSYRAAEAGRSVFAAAIEPNHALSVALGMRFFL